LVVASNAVLGVASCYIHEPAKLVEYLASEFPAVIRQYLFCSKIGEDLLEDGFGNGNGGLVFQRDQHHVFGEDAYVCEDVHMS